MTLLIAASLVIPSGFTEARPLDTAASYVAGHPAHIYCATTPFWWSDYARSNGAPDGANALTPVVGGNASMIRGDICSALEGKNRTSFMFAASLLILVHESLHQSGITDEGQTECKAIHLMPRVAVRFFHVKPGKQLRALMALAWRSHREKPAAYTSVC